MTIQKRIDEYLTLREQLEKLEEGLDELVCSTARRYAILRRKAFEYSTYPAPHGMRYIEWRISERMVKIKWEDWWSYGGHDEGSFEFSVDFLTDESKFDELEQEIKTQKQVRQCKKQAGTEKKERALLAKLQEKYCRGELDQEPTQEILNENGYVDNQLLGC